jgi:hypothetical protein
VFERMSSDLPVKLSNKLAQMVKISSVLTFEIESDAVMSATHEPINEKS